MIPYFMGLMMILPFIVAITLRISSGVLKRAQIMVVFSSYAVLCVMWSYIAVNQPVSLTTAIEMSDLLYLRFNIDKLNVIIGYLAIIVFVAVSVFSLRYFKGHHKAVYYYSDVLLLFSAFMGFIMAADLMTLYVFYMLVAFAAFLLLIFDATEYALSVGRRFVTFALMSGFIVLIGLSILYVKHGDVGFANSGITDHSHTMVFGFLCLFFGFSVSSVLVPFHTWLTEGYNIEAPISALLFGFVLVIPGPYALIRVSHDIFGLAYLSEIPYVMVFLMALTIISMIVGSLYAFHEPHLKRRLAYSTVTQINYITFGVLLLNDAMLLGVVFHMVSHTLIKVILYLCLGVVYKKKNIKDISNLAGVGKELPTTMALFTLAGFALIGLPPSSGFVAKWHIAMGGLEGNSVGFVIILLLSAFITAGYLLPITIEAFFKGPDRQYIRKSNVDIFYMVSIGTLSLLLLTLGLVPSPLIRYILSWIGGVL